ncbi:protein kinase [Streptomyces sp. NPDC056222]|uniref:protein kinase domain-containing protein n=1 Tax=Streptomyces sp. NPDC056222 TaxID=3345749 RepID=UPI0035DECA63
MTVTGANGAELVGEVLGGRYRVTATIGRGGMGVVARAVDQLLNREVAVKVLRAYTDASAAELADLRERMQREAQAAARIRHSGVVTVHDVVEERGLPVIVMELVDGSSLDDVLTQRGPLDPRDVAAIGAKLMDALDAAHRAGVLHRDVKPGNVLLERAERSETGVPPAGGGGWGRVVLTDFGIATMETSGDDAMAKLTQSGQLVGSLDYLPPERAQGQDPGPASDIWSLGMTLYAAVEGTSPFRRTSAWSTLSAIVTEPLPEPVRAGPLAPVLRALMAKEPHRRPDAGQARAMLEAIAAGGGMDPAPGYAQAPPAPGPVTPPPGQVTHALGHAAPAPGHVTHALGHVTQASGSVFPAPGPMTPASGSVSPAPGSVTPAPGHVTHALGHVTPAAGSVTPAPAAAFVPAPAPGPVTPPGAFGSAAAPFQQPGAPGAAQPGFPPGTPGPPTGPAGRSETRTATVRAGRRRARTVVAAAVATVVVGGGVAYGLMNTESEPAGGPQAARPTASAPADGDTSGGAGSGDAPTSPGDLTSMSPGETPAGTPSDGGGTSGPTPTTPGDGDKPTVSPTASVKPKPTPSTTAKEPAPVSTACTGWTHANRSDGYGYLSQNSHLYTGPYAECGWVTAVKDGAKVYYHCYVTNAHGNKWIYARIQGTESEGWVFADKTTGGSGALARC